VVETHGYADKSRQCAAAAVTDDSVAFADHLVRDILEACCSDAGFAREPVTFVVW
jgi:hypothetical protein